MVLKCLSKGCLLVGKKILSGRNNGQHLIWIMKINITSLGQVNTMYLQI